MNNLLSYSSVRLDLYAKDGARLSPASGFVVKADRKYYLITNWHVLSNRDFSRDTGEDEESGLKPYILKTSLHIHGEKGEKGDLFSLGIRKRIAVPLYDEDDVPRWMECGSAERHQPRVDVVALPIHAELTLNLFSGRLPGITVSKKETTFSKSAWPKDTEDWTKISAIPISAVDTDVEYGPPDPVHVIGYPLSWAPEGTDRSSSAFWRTSFIASEIYESGSNRWDAFFIDPSAPEGMTGSPVVGMKNDRLKLLGVYSDHSTTKFGANAGFVWGAWLLKELIGSS